MIAIRATYDGEASQSLEPSSAVNREVSIVILFLNDSSPQRSTHKSQREIAEKMLATRDAMEPLECRVSEPIREGRVE